MTGDSSDSTVIASYGSVKPDEGMVAAAVRLPTNADDNYEVESSSFTCPTRSTSAELRGLILAQVFIHHQEDKTIFTDSLASSYAMQRQHRKDFQYYEGLDIIQPYLQQLEHHSNTKAANLMVCRKTLTNAKIPGHAGDPMNEKPMILLIEQRNSCLKCISDMSFCNF